MIKALIVEDEEYSKTVLENLLSRHLPDVEIIGFASDANEAVQKITDLAPELVFMDIELPYGNAFDILSRLKTISFCTIFTTAYDEYVLKALKAGAVDYLLKPIEHRELIEAVNRVEKKMAEKRRSDDLDSLISSFVRMQGAGTLALPTMEGFSFIKFDDIVRIEADGNYCRVYCSNKQVHTITRQIHEIEEKLPAITFCRIHNSHIVNIGFIKEYVRGRGGYVVMTDGTQVDVSNSRKGSFLERFS